MLIWIYFFFFSFFLTISTGPVGEGVVDGFAEACVPVFTAGGFVTDAMLGKGDESAPLMVERTEPICLRSIFSRIKSHAKLEECSGRFTWIRPSVNGSLGCLFVS